MCSVVVHTNPIDELVKRLVQKHLKEVQYCAPKTSSCSDQILTGWPIVFIINGKQVQCSHGNDTPPHCKLTINILSVNCGGEEIPHYKYSRHVPSTNIVSCNRGTGQHREYPRTLIINPSIAPAAVRFTS